MLNWILSLMVIYGILIIYLIINRKPKGEKDSESHFINGFELTKEEKNLLDYYIEKKGESYINKVMIHILIKRYDSLWERVHFEYSVLIECEGEEETVSKRMTLRLLAEEKAIQYQNLRTHYENKLKLTI